jgi:LacI family transcriptional regulator
LAATINDIAKRTGLGLATISKYLNGGNVRPENKIAIERAIKELDYTVNSLARGLKTNRLGIVGVILPDLINPMYLGITSTIGRKLRKNGYAMIISDCAGDSSKEFDVMEFLLNKNVDGIICVPSSYSDRAVSVALKRDIPILLIDRQLRRLNGRVDSITIDNMTVSRDAIKLLVKKGHTKIGILAGPSNEYTTDNRLKGVYEAFADSDIKIDERRIVWGKTSVADGRIGFSKLMEKNPDITAVFTTDQFMTMGALTVINEQNISIPDDLSLVGYDNMNWTMLIRPKLTLVEQPVMHMGRQAAEIMLSRLGESSKDEKKPKQAIILSARIRHGDSVKSI